MLPTHKLESAKWLSHYDAPDRRSVPFPQVECRFQKGWRKGPGDSSFDAPAPRGRSAFNRLTQEVLRSDASRSFRIETALLALITLISAWPIAIMISLVIRLLK
jgi:hypothetical protein